MYRIAAALSTAKKIEIIEIFFPLLSQILVGLSNMFDKPTMITTLTGGDSNAERSVLPQRLSH